MKMQKLKVDVTGRKMYCLQALPCICQLGNLTGCGSEEVKGLFRWQNPEKSVLKKEEKKKSRG